MKERILTSLIAAIVLTGLQAQTADYRPAPFRLHRGFLCPVWREGIQAADERGTGILQCRIRFYQYGPLLGGGIYLYRNYTLL